MSIEIRPDFMNTVIAGHWLESPNTTLRVTVDAIDKEIYGHAVFVLAIHPAPKVIAVLEDTDCERPEAVEEFRVATEALVRSGVEFYTVLRPNWNKPALHWTRSYRALSS